MKTTITPNLLEAALSYIPANLPRYEWARIGSGIKAEFPDESGRELFLGWSATAGDDFDVKAARSTWQSLKPGGGVTGATVLFEAKQRGFDLAEWHRQHDAQSTKLSPQERRKQDVERTLQRQEQERREKAERQASHERAAEEATRIWQSANDCGEALYLARKGVKPYGVRFTPDGWLLVPMIDAAGKLWNLQRIAGTRPQKGPDKLFLKGGRKSGLFHWCGDPTGAPVLLVAEGYATSASAHLATGRPVAVAFDAGNLLAVCRCLRTQYPVALIVVCGDDDTDTEARTGRNPGREKATVAAAAVGGLAVFPENLPEGGSDFNDMMQSAGIEAVRLVLDHAVDTFDLAANSEPAPMRTEVAGSSLVKVAGGNSTTRIAPEVPIDEHDDRVFDPFVVDEHGVWFCGADQDGKRKPPEWVCSRLEVEALTRDQDGDGWGYLLVFENALHHRKEWAMPSRMLSGDGGEYRATLLDMGLRIGQSTRCRNLLSQYIQTRKPEGFATCTDRVGWHGASFVLPRETIAGDDAERIVFQTDSGMENTFRSKGTADQWRDRVGAMCAGNSRLVFGVCCALAGPLLRPASVEGGGFHFRGDSSSGKTTVLKVAASVYGGQNYLRTWRNTDNSLETTAARHNDCLLILDELAQVDPRIAGDVSYMLSNGQAKGRATRNASLRPRMAWRLLFLSSGELGLNDHMAEGMKRTRTGQEVRMADIPVDAGVGMGAFENLHGHDGGAAFARYMTNTAASIYGSTGRAWLRWLVDHSDTLKANIRKATAEMIVRLVPEGASGQVERVGARFALVAAAGEMATSAGLTGWAQGEAERAAVACFNAWLIARGGAGNGEVTAILRQVQNYLATHGEASFTWWHRAMDDRNAKTLNRCGFRRLMHGDSPINSEADFQREFGDDVKSVPSSNQDDTITEFFVLTEKFKSELSKGFDSDTVARVLLEHDCLVVQEKGRFTYKTRLPGIGNARCYRIPPTIFSINV